MMNKDEMAETAQLEQFDEELVSLVSWYVQYIINSSQYKVVEDSKDPKSDKYLIATSEQPLSAIVCMFRLRLEVLLTRVRTQMSG